MAEREQLVEQARLVKGRHEDELLRKANVVGVGVGFVSRRGRMTEQIGVIVNVRRKVPLAQLAEQDVIPVELEGVPVDVTEVGEIRAL